jgi:glutamate synthase (NADPH/NADH) small chain
MKINRDSVAIKGIERTIIDEAYDNGWVKPKYPKEHKRIPYINKPPGSAALSKTVT